MSAEGDCHPNCEGSCGGCGAPNRCAECHVPLSDDEIYDVRMGGDPLCTWPECVAARAEGAAS